jgi:hypothetical protein
MLKDSVTLEETIAFLNELVKIDREALSLLLNTRVPCNKEMMNHPSVQVGEAGGETTLSILGVLNGMFGIREDGWGGIVAIWENAYESLDGFAHVDDVKPFLRG